MRTYPTKERNALIAARVRAGDAAKDIARELGLSHSRVCRISAALGAPSQHAPARQTMERNALIAARVRAGETLKAIGDEYGLTRERVRQIAGKFDVISQRNKDAVCRRPETLALLEHKLRLGCTLHRAFESVGVPKMYDLVRDKLPADLIEANRLARFPNPDEHRAEFHRIIQTNGGTLADVARSVDGSYSAIHQFASRHYPDLVAASKANQRRLAAARMSKTWGAPS